MQPNSEPPTDLSEIIAKRMGELGITINELAQLVDISYEHARRIVNVGGVPARPVLRLISRELNLDFHELDKMAAAANITKKYGSIPLELSGKNPELEPIERAWQHLTDQQKQDAIAMVKGWAKRNKGLL